MNLPFTMFVVSDLHLEFCRVSMEKYVKLMPKKDLLILAGDIGLPNKKHFSKFLELVSKKYNTVIFIPGNHEYYSEFNDEKIEEICLKFGIIMLQNDFFYYENVAFIGSTLWTNLKNQENNDLIEKDLIKMNDFHKIPWMNINKWKDLHNTSIIFIEKTLRELPKDKIAIVITHHAPSYLFIPDLYKGENLNGCFASSLEYLFKYDNLKTWIAGHTHKSMSICENNTLLYSNPGRKPNYDFYIDWFYQQDDTWNNTI